MKDFFRQFSFRGKFSRKDIARVAVPVVALGLIASVVAGREKPSETAVQPAARIETRIQVSDQDLDLSKLVRANEPSPDPVADPFARRNFAAPQGQGAPQAQAAPAPPPAAPPLPFKYLGKAIEDGQLAVFLNRGEKNYSVQAGQKRGQQLDDEYRVDKVTESSVTFTYLPLKTKQTLDIPAVN